MEKMKSTQLKETLKNLQNALEEFEHIPETATVEIDEFRQKTRDLLNRLNQQIEDLDL
jgi:uncharacterized protein YoxC